MNIIKKIKDFMGFGGVDEKKMTVVTQEEKEQVPKEIRRQLGKKEGQLMKSKEKIDKLEKENKKLKERMRKSSKKKHKKEKKKRREGVKELDLFDFGRAIKSGNLNVKILSREHEPLGNLYTIKLRSIGNNLSWHIIVENDGKKVNVMDGLNPSKMIHRQEGFVNSPQSGVLVLNRSIHSRTPIPDTYVMDYGEQKHIEKFIEDKEKEVNNLYNQMRQSKKEEQAERSRRKMENLDREGHKTRADIYQNQILGSMKSMIQNQRENKELLEKYFESQNSVTSLNKLVESQLGAMKRMYKMVEEFAPKDEVRRAKDEMAEHMKDLKELQKKGEKKEKTEG